LANWSMCSLMHAKPSNDLSKWHVETRRQRASCLVVGWFNHVAFGYPVSLPMHCICFALWPRRATDTPTCVRLRTGDAVLTTWHKWKCPHFAAPTGL
jgi:hypothetical protein